MKLALVASSGGHLAELYALKAFWEPHEHFWVTFPTSDAKYLLANEKVFWAAYPTNRNVPNLLRNMGKALHILRAERPDAVVSTGAGVAVPFLAVGRMLGMKTVYVESITRLSSLSLSGRLVYPYVDKFFVQWPELASRFDKAEYHGWVL